MPAELLDVSWVLEEPNTYQFLVKMLEDPDAAAEYMLTQCTEAVVQHVETQLLIPFTDPELVAQLDLSNGTPMVQCVDNFGALDAATRYAGPQAAQPQSLKLSSPDMYLQLRSLALARCGLHDGYQSRVATQVHACSWCLATNTRVRMCCALVA